MKTILIPTELIITISVSVVGALIVWLIKSWVKGIKKQILEEVQKELADHETRITVGEKTLKDLEAQQIFLTKYLLERKS